MKSIDSAIGSFSASDVPAGKTRESARKLTGNSISALKLPAGKTDHIEWDDEIPGFGIRLREGGSRNWVFQYALGKKQRRMSLGRATTESFKTIKDKDGAILQIGIRERVAQLHAQVKLGQDPAGEKAANQARAGETFEACMDLYLAKRRKEEKLRPTTLSEIERHLTRNLKPLHGLRIDKVDRRAIAAELGRLALDAPVQSNRTRASLVKFLNWCVGEGYIDANPAIFTNKNEEQARERVLAVPELVEIWNGLPEGDFGDILKLLMLTGQRRDEIADLQWDEVDLDHGLITLPPSRTKNHRRHTMPLSSPAGQILIDVKARKAKAAAKARETAEAKKKPIPETSRTLVFGRGERGFSGWSQCKARLDERIQAARIEAWEKAGGQGEQPEPMPAWVIHDLRRAVSTGLGDLGTQPHVVEAVLNHISGTKAGVAGIYNKAAYEAEKETALAGWAVHLMNALKEGQP